VTSTANDQRDTNAEAPASARRRTVFFLGEIVDGSTFDGVLRAMLTREQEVLVALDHRPGGVPEEDVRRLDELRTRYPGLDYRMLPPRRDLWRTPASGIRRSLDYLRYLEPEHPGVDAGRLRAREVAPRSLRALLLVPPFRWRPGRRFIGWLLRRLEAGLPVPRTVTSFVREEKPDVVLVSPLVELGSAQGDYVRAAAAAKVPSVLAVAGRDDQASKGAIRDIPALTLVSSDDQAEDAVRLHGIPRERIEAVGANAFDGDAGQASAAAEAIERVGPVDAVTRKQGRLLRPLLWLLTPLLAIMLVLLRPRVTIRAIIRAMRRLGRRVRKRMKEMRHRRAERRKARGEAAKKERLAAAEARRERKSARAAEKLERIEAAKGQRPAPETTKETEKTHG
jgi:Sec-independent protein translocase protein TatA